jgi:hypothetical protein
MTCPIADEKAGLMRVGNLPFERREIERVVGAINGWVRR